MKMIYNGVCRNIDEKDVKKCMALGYKCVGCCEPQPDQTDLYVVDDYTIAKREKII